MYISNCFLNDFKIPIAVSKIDGQTLYICKLCEETYLTKKSAMEHQCEDNFQPNPCNCKDIEKTKTIKYLLIWLAKKDIPFHAIYDCDFHGFLMHVNKDYKLPAESTLRNYIHSFAKYITKKIYEQIIGKPVSLMINGAKRGGQKYQSLIIL